MFNRFVAFITMLCAAAVSGTPNLEAQKSGIKNVVLVHGARADGSGRRDIHDILVRDDFSVSIVQEPELSFHDDVIALKRIVALQDGLSILVAHRCAGAVITEGGTDSVAELVYVAVAMPDAGENEADDGNRFPSDLRKAGAIKKTADGFTYLASTRFHEYFAADLSAEKTAFSARPQVLNAADNFKAVITTPAWRNKPSWVLAAAKGRTALTAHAQADNAGNPATQDRSYKLLREDENWTFLRDRTLRRDFWDPIKYIPLRNRADNWFLTIGGEAREVWEQIGNDNWGQDPYMNGYLNERYMLSFDAHYGEHVRSFVELKSGLNSYRIGGPRPIDEKKLDFQAGFLEVGTSKGANAVALRVGRQELEFGSGRLVDVREGPNVRLSFDGFMVKSKIGAWQIDGFAFRPDLDKFEFFDNAPDHAIGFWGVYANRPIFNKTSLDVYYLGLNRKQATFERGTAQEVRHSLGARLSRPVATERSGLDFDYEGLGQFGTFGSGNIRAWTVASETGYRFPTVRLKPRFSVKADIASGDNPRSKALGTFNPLFPKGNYFGVLATAGPGPINFIDVHSHVETTFPHNVTASVDWIFQWRENVLDGVYSVPGSLIRPAGNSQARFVGHRPGTELRWQVDRHLWFQADYGVFYAGRFLKETQPGRNLNYWALWAGYKF